MNLRLSSFRKSLLFRRIKKTLAVIIIILSVLFLVGLFFSYYYENTIKHIIVDQLNKRLNTEIEVTDIEKDIEFSLFKNFPYASVTFYQVKVYDAIKKEKAQKGILLQAESISLQFNIWELIFGEYRLTRVGINKGQLHLKIYSDRTDNYHIWKPASDTADTEFSFGLQKVLLEQTAIFYSDYKLKQDFRFFARDVVFKGRFSDDAFLLKIKGDVLVSKIKADDLLLAVNKNTIIDIEMFVDNKKSVLEFHKGNINLGGLLFDVSGQISYAGPDTYLNLFVEGKKMKLQHFINELPGEYLSVLKSYKCYGDLVFTTSIKGYAGQKQDPVVTAEFSIQNGEIIRNETSVALKNLSFNASYTNGHKHNKETSLLNIPGFSFDLNNGRVSGKILIRDFMKPQVHLKLNASLDLKDVFMFVESDTVESASGTILLNTEIKGSVENLNSFSPSDFINSTAEGNLLLQNAEIVLKGNDAKITKINGRFLFNNNDIESSDFSCKYKTSDFSLRGKFKNVLPYLFLKNQKLMIDAEIESDYLDVTDLLQSGQSKKDSLYRLSFPDDVNFFLSVKINRLTFNKFKATNISGMLQLTDKQFYAGKVTMKTMDGTVSFNGFIDGTQQQKMLVSCDADIKKVNIRQFFYQMDNFSQQSLTDKNLLGTLSAKLQMAAVSTNGLEIDKSTLYAKTSVSIENGELINFEPLNGLSKYFKNRDFSHVKFQTLSNTFEINHQLITIPEMDIKSSAVSFQMKGTHHFNGSIDYQLMMLFSEFGKGNKNKNNQVGDIGFVEDDGLHKEKYFFRITGTVDKPVYHTLDKAAVKENIAKNIKNEKQSLKQILNNEFGWFKKDTTLKQNNAKNTKNSYDFKVIWEDDEQEGEEN